MTEQELDERIARNEVDCVKFTVSTRDTDKFSEAVCAFANALPKHDRPGVAGSAKPTKVGDEKAG